MKNHALAQWREGVFSVGAWVNLPDIHSAETLSRMGFEWLCFDLQHGLLSYSHLLTLLPAISASGATPLVRTADDASSGIGRALDAGAHGVIVPMIDTAEQAAGVVAACRYPIAGGVRSLGPMRPLLTDGMGYIAASRQEIAPIAMIETRTGLDNVEKIAAVDGLAALFVGPADLCFGLGIMPGDFANPLYVEATDRIVAAAKAAGIAVGLFGYSPDHARSSKEQGFDFVSAGSDIAFMRQGAAGALGTVTGEDVAVRAGY